jgi:hypothetical protein
MSEIDFNRLRDLAEKHLEGVSDGISMVLKAHLILEETLHQMVRVKCEHPEFLEKAQLRFYQLIQVARAFYRLDEAPLAAKGIDVWEIVEAINTLRNRLAHNLEPEGLGALLTRARAGTFEDPVSLSDPKVAEGVGIVVAM